jgi:Pyruvate/2-oxoacid:ferredoxin oxidoreductase delta subunit
MATTITEQLEEIKEQVCTQLCKWPNIWDEEEEGMELIDSEHCKECPLNRM